MRTLAPAVLAAAVGLGGCASLEPVPVNARLAVTSVSYDCADRVLSVTGEADPARAGQRVQVRVRSAERPRAGVWRIVAADRTGAFSVSAKLPITSTPIDLEVRAASVVRGARVFSPRITRTVTCPAAAGGGP